MNANELFKRIIAYGADEKGIADRFNGNIDLYEICFHEFIEEPDFIVLRDAVYSQNYKQAFEASHALKGFAGNLGITQMYNAIRALNDSLRNGRYENVNKEYTEVEYQYERLRQIASDEPEPARKASSENMPAAEKKPSVVSRLRSVMKDKSIRLFVHLLFAITLIILVVGFLFYQINVTHNKKVVQESGVHLTEISNQIKLYIEDNITTDWKIAQSVGDTILDSFYSDNDPAVFNTLQRKRAVWGVSNLMLYTENGYCIYADGSTEVTDIASMTVYHARKNGKHMSILDSKLIYTIPLNTTLTYNNSEIVAISVVRDMSSFLKDMEFSSFGDTAYIYLTDMNGVIVSSLTGASAAPAFNMQTIIEGREITPLNETRLPEDFLSCTDTEVFILHGKSVDTYGVSVPVMTGVDEYMRLFYVVPINVVNGVMSGFSNQLVIFSMFIIFLFAVGAFTASLILYRNRKKKFDRAIMTRERMFDLLIRNTKTAFGLFTVNSPKPEYLSANAADVTGDTSWSLSKTDTGFSVQNDRHTETENIALVNAEMRNWDGRSTFRSSYLYNNNNTPPTYFVFELYPVDDDINGFICISQDVTSVYAREEAVKEALESAKKANEAKTRFLSSMSHDIRTPMNAIINMSNFALESVDQPKKLGNYLRVIHESADHLLHLINDILDMSRIESGQLIMTYTPFDIWKEIQCQVEMIRSLCDARNQTLITDFNSLKGVTVSGDALKLSQIVINLLSNAVKFTPEKGSVRFIAKEVPSPYENTVAVRISVEDNGIGISEKDIAHIFEPFSRSTDKAVRQTEGTGLGLAIVKNYVDAMGGTINCESELGEGSIFTVEISFEKADMSVEKNNANAALTSASFLGMHALVVEDNRTNQMIAKEILERMGFILDFADDGAVAVQKFRESVPNTYDVIYMDIQMPVMDGYTATHQIRSCEHPQAKTVPIIAMTANAFTEDIEKARVSGMNGYVDKPVVSVQLAEQTKKAIRETKG